MTVSNLAATYNNMHRKKLITLSLQVYNKLVIFIGFYVPAVAVIEIFITGDHTVMYEIY